MIAVKTKQKLTYLYCTAVRAVLHCVDVLEFRNLTAASHCAMYSVAMLVFSLTNLECKRFSCRKQSTEIELLSVQCG